MITKAELDKLAQKYEVPTFINDDPVQFIHRYSDKKDVEIAGFVSSLLAYGSRKQFIKKLDFFFSEIAQEEPLNFIQNYESGMIEDFNYRFGKPDDFDDIFSVLKELYNKSGGLGELFKYGYEQNRMFETVVDYFYSRATDKAKQGFYHMIPNPANGGAMKRMCMYLRWMVRKSCVDVGIWDFITPAELYIPLDVHVARISRQMGLLTRSSNDFKAVVELTNNLKKLCPEDPVKYDFAIFGYGVNKSE
ncbi:MAG: TIGR02757 family protein [Candidatus Gastranaerophilaceae bacterium]